MVHDAPELLPILFATPIVVLFASGVLRAVRRRQPE